MLLNRLRCQLQNLRLSSNYGLLSTGQGDQLATKCLPTQLASEPPAKTAHAGQHLLALQHNLLRRRCRCWCRGCSGKYRLLRDELGSEGRRRNRCR